MAITMFTDSVVRHVLDHTTADRTFEKFCVDLFSEVDEIDYVTTSITYDQGRDGRGVKFANGEAVICCSLRGDVEAKAEADFAKATAQMTVRRVRFCFAQDVSEYTGDKIKAMARKILPGTEPYVEGLKQLSDLSIRRPSHFLKHYAADLESLRQFLLGGTEPAAVKLNGFRIALTTQVGDDAEKLRLEVTRNLILTALSSGDRLTLARLAELIGHSLKLPRAVHTHYLLSAISDLRHARHIELARDGYSITSAGLQDVQKRTDLGTDVLLEGKQIVKGMLNSAVDQPIDESVFQAVWNEVTGGLADLFLAHGLEVVETVASIADGRIPSTASTSLGSNLSILAARVGKVEPNEERGFQFARVVREEMLRKGSDAFRWLTGLCVTYLSVCSLGLEPTAHKRVVDRIQRLDLIPDTHVLLSYLCTGEPDHEAVSRMLQGWARLGGNVWTCKPILEEAAYHAWIAEGAYKHWWHAYRAGRRNGSQATPHELTDTVGNAFVKAFIHNASPHLYPRRWREYIANFKGADEFDFAELEAFLREELGVEAIDEDATFAAFAEEITKSLTGNASHRITTLDGKIVRRFEWDGRLVALIAARRRPERSAAAVSASPALCEICVPHFQKVGFHPILKPSAIAYVLSVAPGVTMGLNSLRDLLFDGGFVQHLPPAAANAERLFRRHARAPYALSGSHKLQEEYDRVFPAAASTAPAS